MQYLIDQGQTDSQEYKLTQEAIDQAKEFYSQHNQEYREEVMIRNFARELSILNNKDVMGIYGADHLAEKSSYGTAFTMIKGLEYIYGDIFYIEDLSGLAKIDEPLRTDNLTIAGKTYEALYYGSEDMHGQYGCKAREFWHVQNAYADFSGAQKTEEFLPYSEYPMTISENQVYVVDYTTNDDTIVRMYYKTDGNSYKSLPISEAFFVN